MKNEKYTSENIPIILIGNKCDLENERVVSFEEGKALVDSLCNSFIETSAKNNINVTDLFASIAFEIMINEIEVKEKSCLLL